MIILKHLLENLILNKGEMCCLCFKDIESSKIGFQDEIVQMNSATRIATKVLDIISYVFGPEILQTIDAFENVCESCTTGLTMCYNFMKDCREKANFVDLAIGNLTDSLEACESTEETKTFYLTINNDLAMAHYYCDTKLNNKRKKTAFQQFKAITRLETKDLKIEKEELKIKSENVTKANQSLSKGSKTKYVKIFRTHQQVRKHPKKLIKCPNCPKIFHTSQRLNKHIENGHQEFICSQCGKKFNNQNSFKFHERNHHSLIVCDDCGRVYKNNNTFRLHIENKVCQSKERSTPAIGKFTCDYCQKRYSQKMTLRVHIQHEHLNYKSHYCKWCNKKFSCKSRMKAHEVTHTKEKNFVCTYCNGKYVSKESLLYHTRLHTGEKPYQCTQCNARFLSASRRQLHFKSHHMDNNVQSVPQTLHECTVCKRKFTSTSYLRRHMKTHEVSVDTINISEQVDNVKLKSPNVHIISSQNLQIGSENILFFDPNEKQGLEVEIPHDLTEVHSVEIVYNDDTHLENVGTNVGDIIWK